MFFVKAAFWIMIIILLLPSNGQERFEFYDTAQRTISDIGGFCGRNPDVCEKTSAMFGGVVQKLRTTAEMIEDVLRDAGIASRREETGQGPAVRGRQGRLDDDDPNITPTSSMAGDTLTGDDLRPSWYGPGDS
jgi:Family of unknown function (DUF5330)